MRAPVHEAAAMQGWSSVLCRGTAAKQTLPVLGRRSSAPSGPRAAPPPAPQIHSHVPVRRAGGENDTLHLCCFW